MSKPRRNDPCNCGSGKKYKRCCGQSNVIAFNPALYNNELEVLNEELIDFSITHFESELTHEAIAYADLYLDEDDLEILDTFVGIIMSWMILNKPLINNQTVYDIYYSEQQGKIKHPRTKKVFSTWGYTRPAVFEIISIGDQADSVIIQDILTNKTYPCLYDDATHDLIGNLLLGVIVPYVNMHDFLYGMIEIPKELGDYVFDLLDDMDINDEEQFHEVFPEFVARVINPVADHPIEWIDPRHEMVAQLYSKHMMDKNVDELVIETGILIWNVYCLRRNPMIKKLGAHAAALEYLMHHMFIEEIEITQAEIAKEYNTTASTVSSNYRKIVDELENLDFSRMLDESIEMIPEQPQKKSVFLPEGINTGSFIMEKEMRNIEALIQEKNFDSTEDLNAFLNTVLNDGSVPSVPQTPRNTAQDILDEARNKQGREQKRLINEALTIYPNSPDAYLLLAEGESTLEKRHDLLLKAVSAGEKDLISLDSEYFKKNRGHFWGLIETRPYMRAKATYAMFLEHTGSLEAAMEHYEELLELNPNDNQGIRDLLLSLYIEMESFNDATKLLESYENDITATFMFNRALVNYLTEGITNKTYNLLNQAIDKNPFVLDYLLKRKKIPNQTVDYITLGNENEAINYAQEHIHLWEDAGELLERYE